MARRKRAARKQPEDAFDIEARASELMENQSQTKVEFFDTLQGTAPSLVIRCYAAGFNTQTNAFELVESRWDPRRISISPTSYARVRVTNLAETPEDVLTMQIAERRDRVYESCRQQAEKEALEFAAAQAREPDPAPVWVEPDSQAGSDPDDYGGYPDMESGEELGDPAA